MEIETNIIAIQSKDTESLKGVVAAVMAGNRESFQYNTDALCYYKCEQLNQQLLNRKCLYLTKLSSGRIRSITHHHHPLQLPLNHKVAPVAFFPNERISKNADPLLSSKFNSHPIFMGEGRHKLQGLRAQTRETKSLTPS